MRRAAIRLYEERTAAVRLLNHERVTEMYAIQRPTSRQPLQLDIAKPTVAAVILQANITLARMIFVGHVEFMCTTIRPFVWFAKLVQINTRHRLSIEHDRHSIAVAGNYNVIP